MSTMIAPRTTSQARVAETPPTRPRLRLTSRGRGLLLLGLVVLLLAAFAVGRSASSQATIEPAAEPAPTAVTVQPGDTLWSVAGRLAPERDPRELVAQIRRLNDLSSASLTVGQQLLLPTVVGQEGQ